MKCMLGFREMKKYLAGAWLGYQKNEYLKCIYSILHGLCGLFFITEKKIPELDSPTERPGLNSWIGNIVTESKERTLPWQDQRWNTFMGLQLLCVTVRKETKARQTKNSKGQKQKRQDKLCWRQRRSDAETISLQTLSWRFGPTSLSSVCLCVVGAKKPKTFLNTLEPHFPLKHLTDDT